MIDLHSHVLPGIDDGTASVDEAVALARAAARRGTRVLAATPHLRADHPTVRPEQLAGRCAELNRALEEAGVPLEVVPGGEVDLDWASAASEEDLRLVSYGQRGGDLLLETPYGPLPADFEERLRGLRGRGYRVLLAHPERSPSFQEDPDRLAALVDGGLLLQVTARTLAQAGGGSAAHRLADDLVRDGLAHVLASDAHGPGPPAPPDLADGVSAARDTVGEARAHWLGTTAPAAVLAGDPLPARPD